MTVLKNVNLMWACTKQVNDYNDKYEVTMAHLTPDQQETLKDLGAVMTECTREGDSNRGTFAKAKSKFQPRVFLGRTEFDGEIGNGSIGNVAFNVAGGGKGFKTGLQLNKIVVTKLVEYEGTLESEDDADLFEGVEDIGGVSDDELVA